MKTLLQKRPFGMPLYLSAIHFALALSLGSILLDLLAWRGTGLRDTTGINVAAYALLVAALVLTVLAALAALADALDLPDEIRRLGWTSVAILAVGALVLAGDAAFRNQYLQDQIVPPVPLFLSVGAIVVLAVAAWLGGTLATREIEEELEEELEEPTPLRKRRRR